MGETPPSTTTLSTIAVKAGDTATVVVALLKANDQYEIRIDEMNPRLLTIGSGVEETSDLLRIHEELIKRLKEKEDKVQALLARADALGSEKENPNEAIVYDAMALNLAQTWKELNKQLMLRGYLLNETLKFYRMARHHDQLTISISDLLRRAAADNDTNDIVQRIEQIVNEIIDTTASAVDLGSSVIAQIRALGQIDDNEGRAQEILAACVLVENVMLRIATEWEHVEQTWTVEKQKFVQHALDTDGILAQIEEWLAHAERKIKALNETGQKRLLDEGNAYVSKLHEMGSSGTSEGTRVSHLRGRIEEFLHYLKTRMNRSQRIQAFFQASQSMLSQLAMMRSDLQKANAAMAGELVPLAKQKASSVIQEGKEILAREVLTYEEQRIVKQRCDEIEKSLAELEEIAKQRKNPVSEKLEQLKKWMFTKADPFLAQNADMGTSLSAAREFVSKHKEFAQEVVNQDSNVIAALSNKSEMDQTILESAQEFERQYEQLKDILENRIQIGGQFEQVHKFAKDLESSFDALTSLLDTNRDFTNEKVAGQMTNVFQMIQETLGQEKNQGDKFINAVEQVGRNDKQLTVLRASESVRNIISDHEHRFTYVTGKWLEWQHAKTELKRFEKNIEEVEMWQEDAVEVIKVLQQPAGSISNEKAESYAVRFEKIRQTVDNQNQKISEASTYTQNDHFCKRVAEVSERQQKIENMLYEIKKMEVQQLVKIIEEVEMWQDDAVEILRKHQQTHQHDREQLEIRLKELKQSAPSQMQRLQRVRNQNNDEIINRRLDVMTERQKQIQGMIEDIELIELQDLRKTVEEVEMWQEDAIEIIRQSTQQSSEIIKEKLERIVEQVPQQAEKVAYLKRHTDKSEVAEKIMKVARCHEQIKLSIEEAKKAAERKFINVVEEIEMWQEETIEIIRILQKKTITNKKENAVLSQNIEDIQKKLEHQAKKIEESRTSAISNEHIQRVESTSRKHKDIVHMVDQLNKKVETINEEFLQDEIRMKVKAPEIITTLQDAQVDEGSRYEFSARVTGEPEPSISWLKDGIDVKNTMDYRQDFINGVATLIIEETFIEDTATYTVRASNVGGVSESSGRLIVKSRSALDSIFEDEKPRVVKQLRNTQVNEGETAHMDCVIVGHPEPEVVWYKEETTIVEDERTRLDFTGDHCSVTIQNTIPQDSGLYTTKAKNVHGETTSFCQLKVTPRKQPPPTPPKPLSRPASVIARPPSIQPAMTNTTWEEGQTATLQVLIQGEPRPSVQWLFNDRPIQQTSEVSIQEKSDGWSRVTISPVQSKHAGLYTVVAENEAGEARTGASLHVSQSITTEHLYQQDVYEQLDTQPVTSSVQTRNASSVEINERNYHEQVNHELSPIPNEKRWVEIIEDEMRQAYNVISPVPQVERTKKNVITEQRWVDEIDELLQIPKEQARTTKVHTEYGQKVDEVSQPDIRHSTTTPSSKMFNIATIRLSPQPEVHKAVTSSSTTTEHVAAIRQGSVPESHQASIKPATSIENIAVIRQNPVRDVHRATTTPTSHLESIAQVHAPATPTPKQDIVTEGPRISRIDDVILQKPQSTPQTKVTVTEQGYVTKSDQQFPQKATTTTTTTEHVIQTKELDRADSQDVITQIHKTNEEINNARQSTVRVPESPRPQRKFQPKETTTVSSSAEGWVEEVHDQAGKPIVKTVRRYVDEQSDDVVGKKMFMVPGSEKTVTIVRETGEHDSKTIQKSQIPKRQPQTSTTVSEEQEGWVQEVHDEAGKARQTAIRVYKEDGSDVQLRQQSKIPIRREPITTTTTSGEGWVQEIHQEINQPKTTSIRTYNDEKKQNIININQIDNEYHHRIADDATSEISKGQRDSYILASDAEGFWTDGAFTGSPTPPPISHFKQDIGTSQVSSEPEFVRPFQKDYTVEEGGSITLECMIVGNPKPKVTIYFNNQVIRSESEYLKIITSSDTYCISINNARLNQAGYYKVSAENKKGYTETLTVLHVRPKSLPQPVVQRTISKPSEHTTVTEEFAMFEYEQRRPNKHESHKLTTPPPAKRLQQVHTRDEEHLEQYDIDERRLAGHPPHFTQTLVSTVSAESDSARFEGVVTGWPAPTIEWTKDGVILSKESLEGISISNIGGRLSLVFDKCVLAHSGKYMCTATNMSGVATSSAQLVVRPKTIAPDFIQRLISEEVVEGQPLKWTVRVTGDPKPKIIWMRDGVEIPNCDEVRLTDEGNGFHSLTIVRAEVADSGQFTCLAENFVGEARSTADLVVRSETAPPGNYFHVTKVTQERQVKGEEPVRNSSFTIENPRPSAML